MLPSTTTGSPLLTLCDTLPPSSPQHSTSTKNDDPSVHSCLPLSNRRSVSATRNVVTLLPPGVRLRSGDLTTLPMTVMALTVLLRSAAPGGATDSVPVCRSPSVPDGRRGSTADDLWTAGPPVDGSVHSELRARIQPVLSNRAFPRTVMNAAMTPAPVPQRRRTGS